jgi:hypothetical protein
MKQKPGFVERTSARSTHVTQPSRGGAVSHSSAVRAIAATMSDDDRPAPSLRNMTQRHESRPSSASFGSGQCVIHSARSSAVISTSSRPGGPTWPPLLPYLARE